MPLVTLADAAAKVGLDSFGSDALALMVAGLVVNTICMLLTGAVAARDLWWPKKKSDEEPVTRAEHAAVVRSVARLDRTVALLAQTVKRLTDQEERKERLIASAMIVMNRAKRVIERNEGRRPPEDKPHA